MSAIHVANSVQAWTIPNDYGYVLIVGCCIALEILLIGFIVAGGARNKVFNKDFLEKHFGEQHKEATG